MTTSLFKNSVVWLCAMLASTFIFSRQAQAQFAQFPCANGINGAGPGERVLGMGPGGILMCGYSGAAPQPQQPLQQAPQRPGLQWVDAYLAVVGHPDAADVWAANNVSADQGGFDGARDIAINACKAAMGDGCVLLASARNGAVVVMRTHLGYFLAWDGANLSPTIDGAQKWCEANNYSCKYLHSFFSTPWEEVVTGGNRSRRNKMELYDPSQKQGGVPRNFHGAISWGLNVGKPLEDKIWASGGHKTKRAAIAAALTLCQNELTKSGSKGKCETPRVAANSVIIAAVDDTKINRTWSNIDFASAEKELLNQCAKLSRVCNIQVKFDTRKEGDESFEIVTVAK